MNAVRSTLTALVLPALVALTGCSDESSPGAASMAGEAGSAPVFRVRADFDAPLNADAGWAGAIGEAVTVRADQPFRLRLEAEVIAAERPLRLALQYRRNAGDWLDVEAHDFPKPSRELALDFASVAIGTQPTGWRSAQDDSATPAVATVDGEPALRAQAGDTPLITLYAPPWDLSDGFKFITTFRLPDSSTAPAVAEPGFAMLFGYVDADNHLRATLDPRGLIRIGRVVDGVETILDEREAGVVPGRWLALEVQYENSTLEMNFEDDTLEYELPIEGDVPVEEFGFRVPAGGEVAFREVAFAGEPSMPRVSAVATSAYQNRAATTDLLPGSTLAFAAGEGVSDEERTAPWAAADAHGEFEWALVIRRLADGAVTNETDDRFEFRLVASDAAQAQQASLRSATAMVRLQVPDGHIGGTFVETPGRIGPWQTSNGDLYFIIEPSETDNLFMMIKSTDGGRSWREVDGADRPETGDLESVDGRLIDGTLHILHQVTESTRYHVFHTSDHPSAPGSWGLTDELATTVTAHSQMATLVVRSDGSIVTVHLGDTLGYSIRSPEGGWSDEIIIEDATGERLAGPQAVLGRDDTVHLAYFREDGTIHHRRLLEDGTLTPAMQLAAGAGTSEAEYGAVLPLVYVPETDTLVVAYRLDDGQLFERRIVGDAAPTVALQISDRPVITDAVDAQQPAADLIGDGSTLHALFIDEETRSIHHGCNDLAGAAGWQPSTLVEDDILGSWVRGSVLLNSDGEKVLGYVYDAGSFGGAGMNRYAELPLGACGQGSAD